MLGGASESRFELVQRKDGVDLRLQFRQRPELRAVRLHNEVLRAGRLGCDRHEARRPPRARSGRLPAGSVEEEVAGLAFFDQNRPELTCELGGNVSDSAM